MSIPLSAGSMSMGYFNNFLKSILREEGNPDLMNKPDVYMRKVFYSVPPEYDNNEFTRGGHTYVYQPYSQGTHEVYDVHSMYPAHAKVLPCTSFLKNGECCLYNTKEPDHPKSFLAYCDVNSDVDIPPIPSKVNGNLFYCNNNFKTYLTPDEIAYYSQIPGLDISPEFYLNSEQFINVSEFFEFFYRKKSESEGFESDFYKLILNSTIGKLAQQKLGHLNTIHPLDSRIREYRSRHKSCLHYYLTIQENPDRAPKRLNPQKSQIIHHIGSDYFITDSLKNLNPFRNVFWQMIITNNARLTLFKAIIENNVSYCDTDSVFLKGNHNLDLGPSLGQWGKEFEGEFLFAAPKLYVGVSDDEIKIRTKGFARERLKALTGQKTNQIRVYGPTSFIKNESIHRWDGFPKRANFRYNKRRIIDGSTTEPLYSREILDRNLMIQLELSNKAKIQSYSDDFFSRFSERLVINQ